LTLNDRPCVAPISPSTKDVLDIGTGTGIWAIEFTDEHPNADVLGTDLSPIQPSWIPPNCHFEVDDAEEIWQFGKQFDLVHGRMLFMGLHNWQRFFQQCWENLKPGGWLEVQEAQFPLRCADDTTARPESAYVMWNDDIMEGARLAGINPCASSSFAEQIKNAGFINVKEEGAMWAIGPWPKGHKEKQIGRYTQSNLLQGLQGISIAFFTRHLHWSRKTVELSLVEVRKELRDTNNHLFIQA